jgi:hypothetical protein
MRSLKDFVHNVCTGFVVDRVLLAHLFLPVLRYYPVSVIQPMLRN